ncbi:alpha/beta hydrolase [Pollutimonas nitritireducens]|uniref:Alpha/beta hydrolase n=1 Tax=Pollutimonas nitritireducens TaxID=2045209 RepID=A0A2N4UG15_9BURK|nr:alpha/beta hydrolase [Pollutimonas nitritireducens]PLC53956.1 alpha/beta hydrolase [Pollutimonas nitritireducens]
MPYLTLPELELHPSLCLYYRHFPGPAGAPKLVLLHELGGTLESWLPLAERLRDTYDIYAFDQRCAGRSEHTSQPFAVWDLARDAVRFADAVGIQGRFVLMGLAMGAVTATHVATRYGSRLSALVLCDGTPSIDVNSSNYLLNRAGKVRADGMRVVAEASFRNAFKGLTDGSVGASWDQYLERFTCNTPTSYALHSEALAAFKLEKADFARIAMPALVLTGEHDFIWPPETGVALAAHITGARFEMVAGAAHFPPIQRPDTVAARVREFLEKEDL